MATPAEKSILSKTAEFATLDAFSGTRGTAADALFDAFSRSGSRAGISWAAAAVVTGGGCGCCVGSFDERDVVWGGRAPQSSHKHSWRAGLIAADSLTLQRSQMGERTDCAAMATRSCGGSAGACWWCYREGARHRRRKKRGQVKSVSDCWPARTVQRQTYQDVASHAKCSALRNTPKHCLCSLTRVAQRTKRAQVRHRDDQDGWDGGGPLPPDNQIGRAHV